MMDMIRLLKIAKEEGIHIRGLQIIFILEQPRYSTDICKELGIKSQNLTSTVDQVRKYIKHNGKPLNMSKKWKVYSLNARGVKFVKRLRGKDK